jgi:catechol 2,3-dioxygenase-like lactoylglutathione lyase family enzyme
LRHITITTDDLEKTAKFYAESFGMKIHAQQSHAVRMSDGVVNLTLIKYRDDDHAGDERGAEFYGIHHIGFEVNDMDAASEKIKTSLARFRANVLMKSMLSASSGAPMGS